VDALFRVVRRIHMDHAYENSCIRKCGATFSHRRNAPRPGSLVKLIRYCHPYPSYQSSEAPDAYKYKCDRLDRGFPGILLNMLKKKVHPLNDKFDEWMSEEFRWV
jgi:hypothetical protein